MGRSCGTTAHEKQCFATTFKASVFVLTRPCGVHKLRSVPSSNRQAAPPGGSPRGEPQKTRDRSEPLGEPAGGPAPKKAGPGSGGFGRRRRTESRKALGGISGIERNGRSVAPARRSRRTGDPLERRRRTGGCLGLLSGRARKAEENALISAARRLTSGPKAIRALPSLRINSECVQEICVSPRMWGTHRHGPGNRRSKELLKKWPLKTRSWSPKERTT